MSTPKRKQPLQLLPPSPRKRRLFFAITVLIPLLLIVLLEVLLRTLNYGPDLSVVTTEHLAGTDRYVMNSGLKYRYFPRFSFNPTQSPDTFSPVKEPGTFRIFCLGGSTTVGYPYWYNGAFSTFLRDRLRAIFPEKTIEVVNFGMTATNSFTVNDMARDLLRYQPDLFIVYDGHNEFYGALGVASNESLGGTRWLTRLYLRLIHFRTVEAVKNFYSLFRGSATKDASAESTGTLMERLSRDQEVPYQSRRYRSGLEIFRENLRDLASLCAGRRIPVIISSQVSNLRDQVPFVSHEARHASPAAHAQFEQLLSEGKRKLDAEQADSALIFLRAAAALDSLHAEAHYRLGQCLDRLRRVKEALIEYERARDLDQLRFRMSTDFNLAVQEEASRGGMIFADIERIFAAASPDSIVGKELMFEHLHPRSRGQFLMAMEYARLIRLGGLLGSEQEWESKDTVQDERLWGERNLTEIDERVAARKTEILTSGWPFTPGYPTFTAVAQNDTLGQIAEEYTQGRWNWKQAHEGAANFYERRSEAERAEKEYRVIINQLPLLDVQDYLNLGRLLLERKKWKELRNVLIRSTEIEPTTLAYRALGDLAMQQKNPEEAIGHYEEVLSFSQPPAEQVENGYLLALACSQAGENDRAMEQLREVLEVRPDYKPAVELLARIKVHR
jgi:tetratricopeptide (TPR) repeat protein